ncbi:ornithine cyclodeaminase family protein [Natronomonas sp.]|uniref:ornithine cyclodeaminase family protein n=1 Tax=Natronomonas sp. TaxID=2184060 RepID=UPI002616BBDB|nr:ornithine cyclodeaminase family protein [Natronomonas sp.]
MVLVLSDAEIESVLDLSSLVDTVGSALKKQASGAVERPERPHFRVGTDANGAGAKGTAIAMPAYVHGEAYYVTKLVGVHDGNPERGLPTVHAQIALTDAETGVPEAFMGGTTVTNARTGCLGALAVRRFAPEAATLGIVGAGAQARWQARAIATVTSLSSVRIYSPSDSKRECAAELADEGLPTRAVETPRAAIEGADVVVTATTATEPVFPPDALDSSALVVAVGAFTEDTQELDPAVFEAASAVFADVPSEAAGIGDAIAAGVDAEDFVSLGAALADGRTDAPPAGPIVVESVGSAVMDAAAGAAVYRRAREAGAGSETPL